MITVSNVSISNYGNYSSDNYGTNATRLRIGTLDLYFSYQTTIAYYFKGELFIRENDWGPTTGKHLNWIDEDKSKRISGAEFEEGLNRLISRMTVKAEQFKS